MCQRLRVSGVVVTEYAFSQQSIGRLATTLHTTIRDHHLALYDDDELVDELANVRLRETSPGVLRMDHDPDKHDDRAIALALAVQEIVGTALPGVAFGEYMRREVAARDEPRADLTPSQRAIAREQARLERQAERLARIRPRCQHIWSPERLVCLLCGEPAPEPRPSDAPRMATRSSSPPTSPSGPSPTPRPAWPAGTPGWPPVTLSGEPRCRHLYDPATRRCRFCGAPHPERLSQ